MSRRNNRVQTARRRRRRSRHQRRRRSRHWRHRRCKSRSRRRRHRHRSNRRHRPTYVYIRTRLTANTPTHKYPVAFVQLSFIEGRGGGSFNEVKIEVIVFTNFTRDKKVYTVLRVNNISTMVDKYLLHFNHALNGKLHYAQLIFFFGFGWAIYPETTPPRMYVTANIRGWACFFCCF